MGLREFFGDTTKRDQQIGVLTKVLEKLEKEPTGVSSSEISYPLKNLINNHGKDSEARAVVEKAFTLWAKHDPAAAFDEAQSLAGSRYKRNRAMEELLISQTLALADGVDVRTAIEYIEQVNMGGSFNRCMTNEIAEKWLNLVNTLPLEEANEAAYTARSSIYDNTRLNQVSADKWLETARQLPEKGLAQAQRLISGKKLHPLFAENWTNYRRLDNAEQFIREANVPAVTPKNFAKQFTPS